MSWVLTRGTSGVTLAALKGRPPLRSSAFRVQPALENHRFHSKKPPSQTPKPSGFHSKTTISIRKSPSVDPKYSSPDPKIPHLKQKIRRILPISPAKH